MRHPGQGHGPGEQPPAALLAFVADQLGISPATFADYARRDQTRREHAAELQAILGLRSFRLSDWRTCLRISADAAWDTNRGEPIVQAMLTHLRIGAVLIPDAAVLERIRLAARAREQYGTERSNRRQNERSASSAVSLANMTSIFSKVSQLT